MTATKKKKRNPQDVTLRNVRATRKAIAALELRVWRLESLVPPAVEVAPAQCKPTS